MTPLVDHQAIAAPAAAAPDRIVQAVTTLRPEEIAEMLANRALIEQAKGMLMLVFGIDAEGAFELLKWRSASRRSTSARIPTEWT